MCLLSSVAFRLVGLVKKALWLLYLLLKVVLVRPTYVSVKHLFCIGHSSVPLQLHKPFSVVTLLVDSLFFFGSVNYLFNIRHATVGNFNGV